MSVDREDLKTFFTSIKSYLALKIQTGRQNTTSAGLKRGEAT